MLGNKNIIGTKIDVNSFKGFIMIVELSFLFGTLLRACNFLLLFESSVGMLS